MAALGGRAFLRLCALLRFSSLLRSSQVFPTKELDSVPGSLFETRTGTF